MILIGGVEDDPWDPHPSKLNLFERSSSEMFHPIGDHGMKENKDAPHALTWRDALHFPHISCLLHDQQNIDSTQAAIFILAHLVRIFIESFPSPFNLVIG